MSKSNPNAKSNTNKTQEQPKDVMSEDELKIATFNLFNYLEPPNAYYEFERIYSKAQWVKKQQWISDYLEEYQPDIIGFQEVFSPNSLKQLVAENGYAFFEVVDQPHVIDDFIYRHPVVAIASKYPIIQVDAVQPDKALAQSIGLAKDFSFSRQVLRATIDIPHIGHCDCYVVHFKSKRSMIEHNDIKEVSASKNTLEKFKAEIIGSWGSSIQRGSEAALLLMSMMTRRETSNLPMVLMGDFNSELSDGVINHLLTHKLRFNQSQENDENLAKYCLKDSWYLFQVLNEQKENSQPRQPSHYFGAIGSVLDYILLSCEFDANYHGSLFEVSDYHTYDRHLINPLFERDGESTDHGIVQISLSLRS